MAVSIYDYIDVASPDKDETLTLDPQTVLTTTVRKNQVVLLGDDNSEEILHFSDDPIIYIDIRYDLLDVDDAGTIMDFWMSTSKGNGRLYSFKFKHIYNVEDGAYHTYVVRFDTDMIQKQYPTYYSHDIIRLKVLGRIEDP